MIKNKFLLFSVAVASSLPIASLLSSCSTSKENEEIIATLSYNRENDEDQYEAQVEPLEEQDLTPEQMIELYISDCVDKPEILADDLLFSIANSDVDFFEGYTQTTGEYKININKIDLAEHRLSYQIFFPQVFNGNEEKINITVNVKNIPFIIQNFDESIWMRPINQHIWDDKEWSVEISTKNDYRQTNEKYSYAIDFRYHFLALEEIEPFVAYQSQYLKNCHLI